ncbi:MAG: amidase family protein, partial [Gemmatimonadota bacterium]
MSGGARADRSWPSLEVLVEAVSAGRTRAAEQVERAFERIEALDRGPDGLNAFVAVDADAARTAAAAVDDRAAADRGGQIGSLAGVPVAVKDNLCTLGLATTCGSRVLEGYRSPYEATVVRRLRDAGAVVVGKTNMDEFAMGSSTESSAYGPTRNPHDPTRVPGGSSGGSAAAVAAGLVPAALGSSTGGSVRQPAAFCGIVGLKPTYGRVSRYGLVAFASSLDQVGTFGRTVADAARLLAAIEGPDRFDSTAAPRARRPAADWIDRGLEGLVVGVPEDYFPRELDDAVAAACRAAIDRLRAAGALIRELALPHTRYAIPAYYVLAPAEASSNLARYDGVR